MILRTCRVCENFVVTPLSCHKTIPTTTVVVVVVVVVAVAVALIDVEQ